MDDLHSSSQFFCCLFPPRYLEKKKKKKDKILQYDIVTIKLPQYTSLLYSWFKYFFRDSHYDRRYVVCKPSCYSLRGRLLDEESDTRGNTTGRGVSQASTLPLPPNPVPENRNPQRGVLNSRPVADPGEGPGGPGAPLFLHQTEARRAEKNFF